MPAEPVSGLISAAGYPRPGTVLILNGASSSGKTALVRALQDRLTEPFLDAGLDRFLWMLPRRYLERPLWDGVLGLATEAGPDGHRLVMGMHRAIQSLSLAGIHVVADHVLVEMAWVQDCASLLAALPAYLIGVRCPLEVLEQRERQRRDRTLGQARAQHAIVHAHGVYDLQVDTSLHSPEECAGQVEAFLRRGDPPRAFCQLAGIGA
jgi:chloramphenicol 3-O phosphotransferase